MRLVDVDLFHEKHKQFELDSGVTLGWHSGVVDFILDELLKFPSIDPVEAAGACRCKDCKHWSRNIGVFTDSANGYCFYTELTTNQFDFCSSGRKPEPKEDLRMTWANAGGFTFEQADEMDSNDDAYCSISVETEEDFEELKAALEHYAKRGQWIRFEDGFSEDTGYKCSVCGEEFVFIEGTPEQNFYNYCPNCGVKMEG